ncbi:MAG: glycosyltransferase family 1 protein [Nitriliruptoraceae bacterium]|nr:glycosyltransferase family 1 protein [Nitriliruptoraceae bacterium]
MRIAVVTESFLPTVNGVSRSVRMVIEHLAQRGHDPLVIAPGPGPDTHRGIPVVRLPAIPLPLCRDFPLGLPTPQLRRTLARHAPDVVHLASPASVAARGAVIARDLGLPSVAIYQTDLAGFASQYHLGSVAGPLWRYLRRVHEAADRTLAPSRAAVDDLERHGLTDVHRWGRGVDLEAFSPAHRRRALPRAGTPVRVGYVGRLAPEKRLERLAVLRDVPGIELVIVGHGSERRRLERRLPFARFTGALDGTALSRAYADLDVFVHPGRHETFSQAVQEALASGVPVVASAVGGPVDLVTGGRTGLLVDPDDPFALREAVAALAISPNARLAYGRRARHSVLDRSWDRVIDELEGHYADVIARATRPRAVRPAAASRPSVAA